MADSLLGFLFPNRKVRFDSLVFVVVKSLICGWVSIVFGLSMGALDEGHCNGEVKACFELGFEKEVETVAIEDAVKVLLQGLGEDVNREGLQKTPLRVAKALREGTRGVPTFLSN